MMADRGANGNGGDGADPKSRLSVRIMRNAEMGPGGMRVGNDFILVKVNEHGNTVRIIRTLDGAQALTAQAAFAAGTGVQGRGVEAWLPLNILLGAR